MTKAPDDSPHRAPDRDKKASVPLPLLTLSTMAEGKKHVSIVICGHVDAGKSTTTGRLIFELGGISEREMVSLHVLFCVGPPVSALIALGKNGAHRVDV